MEISLIRGKKRVLIPEAAHRETEVLIVVVLVDIAVTAMQVSNPGAYRVGL